MTQGDNAVSEDRSRILVADGDEDNLRRVEAELRRLGYIVVTARDGIAAFAGAKEDLGVILLGGHLPGIDTIELLRQLQAGKATGGIPVILMAAASAEEERAQALQAHVEGLLTLPVDLAELQAAVSSLLQLRRYREEVQAEVARQAESFRQTLGSSKAISLDTVYRLSRIAEFRDGDTHGHIERISHYSTALARKLGLDEAFLQNILFAAPLHDVGKIVMPDNVLRKPGRLDDDEWEVIKQHTPFGEQILKDYEVDFLKMARVIAATHHEKWDGTGYPRGLRGEEIPLAGRIVAVVDAFDVMTWERPYKKPLPPEKALAIIKGGRGTQFDPGVVDAFFGIEDEIIAEFNWWQFMASDSEPASV